MGGGGSGYFYGRVDPEDLARKVKASESSASNAAFEASVNEILSQALGEANNRDVAGVQRILNKIEQDIATEFEGAVEILFGGSVAKKTHIEGLSDIDALVLLNHSQISGETPHDVRSIFVEKLQTRFGYDAVSQGQLAVTVKIEGMVIQLLPAMREGDRFKISNNAGTAWSSIHPRKFAEKLVASNKDMGGKLIPTIKLAKSIIYELPEQQRLSGYHCEALAIKTFSDYSGKRTLKDMLRYFFENASKHILSPIKDSTRQSIHVDDYLGAEGSLQRRIASDALGRIGRKIANADAANSPELWKDIIGFGQ